MFVVKLALHLNVTPNYIPSAHIPLIWRYYTESLQLRIYISLQESLPRSR